DAATQRTLPPRPPAHRRAGVPPGDARQPRPAARADRGVRRHGPPPRPAPPAGRRPPGRPPPAPPSCPGRSWCPPTRPAARPGAWPSRSRSSSTSWSPTVPFISWATTTATPWKPTSCTTASAIFCEVRPPGCGRACSVTDQPPPLRSGFVSLIGRPNAGKSTLLNRLVGERLAIVSPRPQTTRNRITGILHRPDAQIVFIDTPGLHAGGGKLGEFMLQTARRAVKDVDVVCLVVDAADRSGPDDLVLAPLREYPGTTICALNKIDLVKPKGALLPLLERWRAAHAFEALVPIAAADGTNCDRLLAVLLAALPEHPPFFPADPPSDH